METLIALGAVSIMFVVSQVYWMKHSQTLVDKVMSRDFNDYQLAVTRGKKEAPKPKAENTIPEDLRGLQEFTSVF